jgi:hypothetical protein
MRRSRGEKAEERRRHGCPCNCKLENKTSDEPDLRSPPPNVQYSPAQRILHPGYRYVHIYIQPNCQYTFTVLDIKHTRKRTIPSKTTSAKIKSNQIKSPTNLTEDSIIKRQNAPLRPIGPSPPPLTGTRSLATKNRRIPGCGEIIQYMHACQKGGKYVKLSYLSWEFAECSACMRVWAYVRIRVSWAKVSFISIHK